MTQVLAGDWGQQQSYKPNQLGNSRFPSRSSSLACHSNAGIRSLAAGLSTCSRVGGTCSSRCGRRTCVDVVAKVRAVSTPSGRTPRWLVDAIHTGRYPRQRHTMEPWRASDRQRALAGSDLGFVGAMIRVKGDWAEFAVVGSPHEPIFSLRCKWWARRDVSRDRRHLHVLLTLAQHANALCM